MLHRTLLSSVLTGLLVLSGCGGGADDDGGSGATGGQMAGTGATGGGGSPAAGGTSATGGSSAMGGTSGGGTGGMDACATTVVASDADNYQFHSELSIKVTKVKPDSELMFDWSGVKTDLLGHDVDFADIGMVEIGLWKLTLEEFEQKLNDDTLSQQDLEIIATILPDGPTDTSGSIFDLTQTGAPLTEDMIRPYLDITAYPPENHLYTAMVADGTALGKGTRMIHGFQLDASSTNTDVVIDSSSTSLSMTANLHDLTSPTVPVGTPAITVDWTNMQTTAAGLTFEPTLITQIRVGQYSLTPTDMEAQETFLNLDTKADVMYRAEVTAGTSFDLSMTKDDAGNAFPGIDATHTWIVALNCGACANPAPWYLTVLKPCSSP